MTDPAFTEGEHGFGLVFAPDSSLGVVAVCRCGWRGEPHRPEQHGGNISVWLDEHRAHLEEVPA